MVICFKPKKLLAITASNEMNLIKCIYDRDLQIKMVSEVCEFHTNEITNLKEQGDKFDWRSIAEAFFRSLCSVAPIIKHPSFKDGNEWRIKMKMNGE